MKRIGDVRACCEKCKDDMCYLAFKFCRVGGTCKVVGGKLEHCLREDAEGRKATYEPNSKIAEFIEREEGRTAEEAEADKGRPLCWNECCRKK